MALEPNTRLVMLEAMFNQYQVGLVGFDVSAEKDESSGVCTLERLRDGSLSHIPEYAALEKLGLSWTSMDDSSTSWSDIQLY